MENYDTEEIVQYMKEILLELQNEIKDLFIRYQSKQLKRKIKIGADDEQTTKIDKFAEDFLIKKITSKFKCKITSEEMGIRIFASGEPELSFILDPIDGTKNAIRKSPLFSCSIAVLKNGIVVAGVIRDLSTGDVFHATSGKGAFFNDRRISKTFEFQDSETPILISRPISDSDFIRFRNIAQKVSDYRMFGCPSLEICYVAARKFRAAIQIHEHPKATMMDIAAAKLILEEAGGKLLSERLQKVKVVEDPKEKLNFVALLVNDNLMRSYIESVLMENQ